MTLFTKMPFVAIATLFFFISSQTTTAQKDSLSSSQEALQLAKHWEKDAEEMLKRWHRDYANNEKTLYAPAEKSLSGAPIEDSDVVRRTRLAQLPTELKLPYNKQVKEGINLFVKRKKRLVPTLLSLGSYYFPTIEKIFDKYDIPLELKYLAVVESNLNPSVVSPSGAKGLWQFMLPTAKAYGLEVSSLVDERLDLEKSTDAAARHLLDLYGMYKDWLLVIAAYNAGIGTINRAIHRSGKADFWGIYSYLPRQTRDYIPLFIATYYAMHHHAVYHMQAVAFSYPSDVDTVSIRKKLSIKEIAQRTKLSESFIRLINPQFKSSYIPGHIRPYVLTLPLSAISLLEQTDHGEVAKASDHTPLPAPSEAMPPSSRVCPDPSRSYTIRKGDSLYKIARMHGVSLKDLMNANNIKKYSYKLIPGKALQIPEKSN